MIRKAIKDDIGRIIDLLQDIKTLYIDDDPINCAFLVHTKPIFEPFFFISVSSLQNCSIFFAVMHSSP